MKIILIQTEIEEAIKAYISDTVNLNDRTLSVDLTAGRGSIGFSAEISVTSNSKEDERDAPAATSVPTKLEQVKAPTEKSSTSKEEPADDVSLFSSKKDDKATA